MKLLAQVTIPDYSGISGWKLGARPTLGGIINEALKYVFVFAGLAMFGSLLLGGFDLLTSAGEPGKVKQGTNKILFGIVGFLIIFSTYWILQLVERIFGLTIL